MEWRFWHVLIAAALCLTLALVALAVTAKLLGWAFVGISLGLIVLVALLIGSTVAWPLAYAVIAIAYWARPNPTPQSTHYSIDQGRAAGEGEEMRGESSGPG